MDNLKARIEKGRLAEKAYPYFVNELKRYRSEIIEDLEKHKDVEYLHGMAFMLKRIEQDILRDISQAEDAFKHQKLIKEKNFIGEENE